jgi:GTPase SAR1 family protein
MASVDMFKRKHKILKYCILIIGLSGAGKTALYNCLANKKMIGNS